MYTRLLSRSCLAPALRPQSPLIPTTATRRAFSVTTSRSLRSAGPLYAASPVAGKPASEDVKDMAKNAVEEGQGAFCPKFSRIPPHLSKEVRSFSPGRFLFAESSARTGIARTVTGAIMGEANDVTSQRAPKENFGAGDIKEDVVRSRPKSCFLKSPGSR